MIPFGVIYLITNEANGKRYVGQTTYLNPISYYRGHLRAAAKGSDKVLAAAIRKYGDNNFRFEVIYSALDRIELNRAEDYFIVDVYDSLVPNGYNVRRGGTDGALNEKSKQLISVKSRENWADPEYRARHQTATLAAMSDKEVLRRCGDAMRGRRWITDGLVSKVIAAGEEVPEGWKYGRISEISGWICITNGDHYKRIPKDTLIPGGWYRGNNCNFKIWYTNGIINKRCSVNKIPDDFYAGFTIKSITYAEKSGAATRDTRWITNGVNNRRIRGDVPLDWRYGKS